MERVITACSMPFFAKGDFTMGVFSEIVMEQQNSMFDSSAAFEDCLLYTSDAADE